MHQKEIPVTVRSSAACLIQYSFLNPSEAIISEKYAQPVSEMHGKRPSLQPVLANRKGPARLHDHARPHFTQPMLQKWNKLGYRILPHLPCSPGLLPTSWHFFKQLNNFFFFFCRENASITNRRQTMLSKGSLNSEAWIFMLRE